MKYIVGIDEVGRGSLAGPLVVAAVAIPVKLRIKNYELGIMKDSKKITPSKREKWFEYFKNHPEVSFALSRVYPRTIEKKNVSKAANIAALRAYNKLIASHKLPAANCKIYLDGGLYLGNSGNLVGEKTIIKGDEKYKAIKIASIIAKVSRDHGMARLAKKYPGYGFEVHKGYGTKRHINAIRRRGLLNVHRLTFVKNLGRINRV